MLISTTQHVLNFRKYFEIYTDLIPFSPLLNDDTKIDLLAHFKSIDELLEAEYILNIEVAKFEIVQK